MQLSLYERMGSIESHHSQRDAVLLYPKHCLLEPFSRPRHEHEATTKVETRGLRRRRARRQFQIIAQTRERPAVLLQGGRGMLRLCLR